MELLKHMLQYAKRRLVRPSLGQRADCRCGSRLRPSDYLDVHMYQEQHVILDPSIEDLTSREILKDAGGEGATKKLARRKLDSTGFMNNQCFSANSNKRLKIMKAQLELVDTVAQINRAIAAEKAVEKQSKQEKYSTIAPAAILKLRAKDDDFNKLTKNEMAAIAFTYFMKAELKGSKPDHMKAMSMLVTQHSSVMPRVLAEVSQQARAVQPAADLAGQSDGDSDEESSSSDEEEVTIADMILACQQEQVEQAIEDPMSDDPELSDGGL